MGSHVGYRCIRCGAAYRRDLPIDSRGCPDCCAATPANLRVVQEEAGVGRGLDEAKPLPSLWRYDALLPFRSEQAVSLGEGLTPLLRAPRLGAALGMSRLFVKDESRNPTWSHKDRFSTVAVTAARALGAKVVATSSSGNAGASLAAYAARAGLACVVATFAGAAGPMLAQIRSYGAAVVTFERKTDRWAFLTEGAERHGWFATSPFRAPVVGSHPIGLEGYKTLAWEIVEQLEGEAPDWCVLPVCYGDALVGLWWGFEALEKCGRIERLPRLVAAEVHGSLAAALAQGSDSPPDMGPAFESLATSIGATRSTYQALSALRQSGGLAVPVGNDGLIALQHQLAEQEGIFAELASVTPLAAVANLKRKGVIAAPDRVVAVVTASGLKDVDRFRPADDRLPAHRSTAAAWDALGQEKALGSRSFEAA